MFWFIKRKSQRGQQSRATCLIGEDRSLHEWEVSQAEYHSAKEGGKQVFIKLSLRTSQSLCYTLFHLTFPWCCEAMMFFSLQMRKLKTKWFIQSHTARKWQISNPRPMALTIGIGNPAQSMCPKSLSLSFCILQTFLIKLNKKNHLGSSLVV